MIRRIVQNSNWHPLASRQILNFMILVVLLVLKEN